MMNLPVPPTDNLYKFIAITGLLLYLALFLYLVSFDREFKRALDSGNEVQAVLRAQLDNTRRRDLSRLLATHTPKEVLAGMERDEARTDSLVEKSDQYGRQMKSLIDDLNQRRVPLIVISTIGGLVMVVGFILWYRKVQRHQDTILAAQARQAASGSSSTS